MMTKLKKVQESTQSVINVATKLKQKVGFVALQYVACLPAGSWAF